MPIVDWGIRAHPFTAPLRLQAQLVSIDRRAAIGALRAPGGAGAGFGRAEDDAPSVVASALERASVVAICWGALPAAQSAAWCCSCSRDGG